MHEEVSSQGQGVCGGVAGLGHGIVDPDHQQIVRIRAKGVGGVQAKAGKPAGMGAKSLTVQPDLRHPAGGVELQPMALVS